MIFLNKHGRTAVPDGTADAYGAYPAMPVSQACGYTDYTEYGTPEFGPFDHFFHEAGDVVHAPGKTAALDALADAMVEQTPSEADDSRIPRSSPISASSSTTTSPRTPTARPASR